MQRLASLLRQPGSQPTAATPHQQSADHRNTHTSQRGWPYAPTPDAHVQPVASTSTGSSPAAQQAQQASKKAVPALQRTVSELLEQIRHMRGAREIWEMAVKRNGMTTSLALLGGVLFADLLLYRPGSKRQAMMQSSLAAAHSSSSGSSPEGSIAAGANSSGGRGSAQQQQQQSASSNLDHTHRDLGSQLPRPAAGVLPAHV